VKKERSGKKNIICSCGTCSAACTVADQLLQFLAENGIDARITRCNTFELESCYKQADLILSTCQLPPRIDRPKISSVPFFTGNGLEETKKKILQILS